jgi:phenylpropionate dioxygenase-like ring-hydroxylating dioxygenase large terminal subunit
MVLAESADWCASMKEIPTKNHAIIHIPHGNGLNDREASTVDAKLQKDLLERISAHREVGGTDLAPRTYLNPTRVYTDPIILAGEKETLFSSYPIAVGLSGDAPEPGDWFTFEVDGKSMLFARQGDCRLVGFFNVCRHRGAPVASERGKDSKKFICPYHGWTYALDGALVGQPTPEGFSDRTGCDNGLRRIPVTEEDGIIWAIPIAGNDGFSMTESLGGMKNELASYNLSTYHRFETRYVVRAMNWKMVIDTFLEAYHLDKLHKKTLAPMVHAQFALFDSWGKFGRLAAARTSIDKLDPKDNWDLAPHTTLLYFLFPNTVLIQQQDHVEIFHASPHKGRPDEASIRVSLYSPDEPKTDSERRHWLNNFDLLMDVTGDEDFALCEEIQKGFSTGAQEHITFGRNEPGLQHYHRSIKQALGLPETND